MTPQHPASPLALAQAAPSAPAPNAETPAPDVPIPRLAVPLLSLAAFASGVSPRVSDPLLPHLAAEFHVSLGDASAVITVFSVAYGLAQLFFGPVGDRYGKYFIVACACIASAITATLCALAPNFQLLLGARLLAGATAAAVIPLAMAWIGDVVAYAERQALLARFLIGQILGLATGVLAGGLAADYGNWRLPFAGVALVFLAVAVALLSLNRRLPARARIVHKAQGPVLRRMIGEFLEVLRQPWARVVLLTVFLEGAALYGAFAFIASHAYRVHGMSLTGAGALVMFFGFGGFLYALASAALVRRMGETGLALWGGICMAAALLAIALAPVWWWLIPGCFLTGLGFYMLHNTLQINATQMAPQRRGAAVSAFASCFFLGQSVGVGAAGLAVGRIGTTAVIAAGAVGVALVGAAFNRRLKTRH